MRTILTGMAVAAMLLMPGLAVAAEGFSTANVNMRSGPSTRYPAVTVIPLDTELEIHGCLADVPWCDVSFYQGRGWVAAQYIATDYRRNRVDLQPRYYRPLGIPTITFDLGNYWERNYRNRDFYRDRARWGRSDNDGNRRERRRNSDQYDNDYGQSDDNRPPRDYGDNDDSGYGQDRDRRERRDRHRERRRVIEENNSVDQFEGDNDNRRRRNDSRQEEVRPQENFREEQPRNNDRRRDARPGTCAVGDVACAIEKAK
ncbi:SH3 domain-containing protein [Rhizobium sp. 32-5/1]|uniref:SH3 domain-containing protein n=1 Tax=Rhizobium sp. 32-5/1 TaxID=3019602 RepID=UPI00240DF44A|nr:SH3 domain-containing protein [Rhizobium sp. 32-5/1]WEZ84004.1 SH3 domain-containing protein [Rhizobium sp. 32-5/1]